VKRRFNSTGRLTIPREAVTLRVIQESDHRLPYFTADLSGLAALGLPPTARVIVEPWVKQSSMRFDFGTVQAPAGPQDTSLVEIDRGSAVQFRIKVVDTIDQPGKLLAAAYNLRPVDEEESDDRKSLLPVLVTDLGEVIWKIEVGIDVAPQLLLNSRIPGIRGKLDDDPLFRGSILIPAIKEVARVVLFERVTEDQEWVSDWRSFMETLLKTELQDSLDPENDAGVPDDVVEAFCARERIATAAKPQTQAKEIDYE
jgi:hypothetical protein